MQRLVENSGVRLVLCI